MIELCSTLDSSPIPKKFKGKASVPDHLNFSDPVDERYDYTYYSRLLFNHNLFCSADLKRFIVLDSEDDEHNDITPSNDKQLGDEPSEKDFVELEDSDKEAPAITKFDKETPAITTYVELC